MPDLVLGPLLRYVGETSATVWVETDAPCEVEILGRTARTFCVNGHHYALVVIEGLEPGSIQPYEVALDGERRWPEEGSQFPPSLIRTIDPEARLKIVFGSCRVAVPHHPPYTLTKDQDDRGREIDALYALATRMRERTPADWPALLMAIGDQVYADEDAPQTREFIRSRRDTSKPPHEEVLDYEEYTHLYRESWGEPEIRWLLSTVGTMMIFDDHDVHDDWNSSAKWVREMRAKHWWTQRIRGALASYYVYQHLGNLSPARLARSEVFKRVQSLPDAGEFLCDWAEKADLEVNGSRWSYSREYGRIKIVVFDSREGRVLDRYPRKMVDDREWEHIVEEATGDFDHLLLADTLPMLMSPGAALPGGLERGRLRRRVGASGEGAGRMAAPRPRPRALARVRRLLQADDRAAALRGRRRAGNAAGDDRDAGRRRAPRLPGRGRLQERGIRSQRRLPGRLLTLPQRPQPA